LKEPNLYTYSALINGPLKENKVLEVDNIFGNMLRKGLAPSPITYKVLIYGLRRAGASDLAFKVVDTMVK